MLRGNKGEGKKLALVPDVKKKPQAKTLVNPLRKGLTISVLDRTSNLKEIPLTSSNVPVTSANSQQRTILLKLHKVPSAINQYTQTLDQYSYPAA